MEQISDATDYGQPGLPPIPRSPLGHRLMFLLLTTMAFVIFAPAVILPVLREYGELAREEDRLKLKVARLQEKTEHRADLAEAFAHDTLINERLAVLDLHYEKRDEEVVYVLPQDHSTVVPSPIRAEPATPLLLPAGSPEWALRMQERADRYGLLDLFFDHTLRPVLLLMALGLLVAAFLLYAPKAPPHESDDANPPPRWVRPSLP